MRTLFGPVFVTWRVLCMLFLLTCAPFKEINQHLHISHELRLRFTEVEAEVWIAFCRTLKLNTACSNGTAIRTLLPTAPSAATVDVGHSI